MVPGVLSVDCANWGRDHADVLVSQALKMQDQSVFTISKSMSIVSANAVIFSTLKHTDAHTVRGRSTLKDGNDRTIRNGPFRELKIARKSIDTAKVLPEPNQKSHELSIIRKCAQLVTKDGQKNIYKRFRG